MPGSLASRDATPDPAVLAGMFRVPYAGNPPVDPVASAAWRNAIAELARADNVVKLSGLVTRLPEAGTRRPAALLGRDPANRGKSGGKVMLTTGLLVSPVPSGGKA